jgi:pyruvate/2-oxoglutarate dehydrogenase complex dihydrolipoamide acyltransferase (E2) component
MTTDKLEAEVPSPATGVLMQILHPVGATVPVDTIVALIEPA